MIYQYITRIKRTCELLQVEPLLSAAPLCGEMVLTSKKYDTYEECVEQATNLISTLATIITQVTDVKHIAVSKENPLHAGDDEAARADGWASNTICRIYAADQKRFKRKKELAFSIHANINVVESFVDMTYHNTPNRMQ